MDFDSLPRRDLQFFCKKNKIPANMTNIAMADALKALEIVEGIDEFMNQSEFTRDQSPTSVAKNLPSAARTAARTTRRKTTKDDTQSSELVTRSCLVTTKSLAGEMDQENKNMNMLQDPSAPQSRRRAAATSVAVKLDVTDIMPEANVSKTPAAARSTRRAQAAESSKKDETVQRVYSTRRSVRLLEESMADLSLKTKESINVQSKKNEDSPEGSKFQEKSNDNSGKTEDAEVLSVRDLNDSWKKEWDGSKNDPDLDVLYGDLGDITFSDENTTKEQMDGIESNTVIASDSFVMVKEVLVSEEKKTQASPPLPGNELEVDTDEFEVDSDEWSDYDTSEVELEENSFESKESIDNESEEAPVSEKKTPASSSSTLSGKETKTPLSPFEAESILESDKNMEMVVDKNEEGNADAEAKKTTKKNKKKPIDEESFKDVSMRQLTKMVKELAIKSKQQHKCAE